MAFAYTVTGNDIWGRKRVVMGTFSQVDDDTGGDIVTGLRLIEGFDMSVNPITVSASGGTVSVTLAGSDGNQEGFWKAVGL